jgi:hypothetical protein
VGDRFLKILKLASLLKPSLQGMGETAKGMIWMSRRTRGEGVTMESNSFLEILELTSQLKTSS